MTVMELRDKKQQLSEMQTEIKRSEQESSSRLANLNQALLQSKKSCTQLEIGNDELKQHEADLQREIEELKTKCSEFAKKVKVRHAIESFSLLIFLLQLQGTGGSTQTLLLIATPVPRLLSPTSVNWCC